MLRRLLLAWALLLAPFALALTVKACFGQGTNRPPVALSADTSYAGTWQTDYTDGTHRHWALSLDPDGSVVGRKFTDSGAVAYYRGTWGAAFGTICFFSPHEDTPPDRPRTLADVQCYGLTRPDADHLKIGVRLYFRLVRPYPLPATIPAPR